MRPRVRKGEPPCTSAYSAHRLRDTRWSPVWPRQNTDLARANSDSVKPYTQSSREHTPKHGYREDLVRRKVLGEETHPFPTLTACGCAIRLGPHTKKTGANHGQCEDYRDRRHPEPFCQTHSGVSEEGSGRGKGHARYLTILRGVDKGLSEVTAKAN